MSDAAHDRAIAEMFDRIAPRYDRLNRVLSFGTDVGWRRRALALADIRPGALVLDVGAGTGDLARAATALGARALALDLSAGMLAVHVRLAGPRALVTVANAEALPLRDGAVDRIVTAFTVRNVADLPRAFREFRRVLRADGRAVILELSHPPGRTFAAVYAAYFEHLAPRIATALGGDVGAYRYLPRSLREFPGPDRLAELLRDAGFSRVRFERLARGIATIHVAEV
jgi:demethylmenaquinone methyltransferase/2-methoxy-6-polyprenyl-1,4-benzoquinol methylase